MRIEIGPVSAAAAWAWTSHLLHNLRVVQERREELPFAFPAEVASAFEALLSEWNELAAASGEGDFVWSSEMEPDRARWLLRYWANLEMLSPEMMDQLGIEWSPPEARPFFAVLVAAVAAAFEAEGLADPFADLLAERGATPPSTKPS